MTGYEAKPAPLKLGAPMTKEEKEASLPALYGSLHGAPDGIEATEAGCYPWSGIAAADMNGYVVTSIPATWAEFGDIAHLAAQLTASE